VGQAAGRAGAERAARLSGAALAVRERIGTPVPSCEQPLAEATAAAIHSALGGAAARALRAAGAAADLADLVAEAVGRNEPRPVAESGQPPVPAGGAPTCGGLPPAVVGIAAIAKPAPGAAVVAASGARTSAPAAHDTAEPVGPAAVVPREPPQSATLWVYSFGPAREHRGDHLLGPADWTYQKPRELLHFLLSQQACTKEQIGLALWPEADAETLRNSFHTTLRHLRRALGSADWVVFDAGRYRLNRSLDYVSDVERFESGLAAARAAADEPTAIRLLDDAVAVYRGDFLADLPGGGWIEPRRADLRRQAEAALLTLGELLRARGRSDRAADAYRRLVAIDGLLEVAHRQLMQCYADLGERGRALRQYAELVDLLAAELGVAPAPETTALYHRLRRELPAGTARATAGATAPATVGATARATAHGTTGATTRGTARATAAATAAATTRATVGATARGTARVTPRAPVGAMARGTTGAAAPGTVGATAGATAGRRG